MTNVIYTCKCGRESKHKKCTKCRNHSRKLKQKQNFKLGLCRCGGLREQNKSKCLKCLISQRRYRASFRRSRINKKQCLICGNVTKGDSRYCDVHLNIKSVKANQIYSINKKLVFNHYGNTCICCGETVIEFMTIDHIKGDGYHHRKSIGPNLYKWLVNNCFPVGFQTMCMQCNSSKGRHGKCAHEFLRSYDVRCIFCTRPIKSSEVCSCHLVSDFKSLRLYHRQRIKCLVHYGLRCKCCGESEIMFLTIDHMNNDGNEHRKTMKSYNIYRWLIKYDFPVGFQTLCMQCNFANGKLSKRL